MKFVFRFFASITAFITGPAVQPASAEIIAPRHTVVSIAGEDFLINGEPTFKGRTWQNHRIEGLLPNARVVQGIFDDLNPATRENWNYPDTGKWDPDRNSNEFISAMPVWRAHGLLAITLNMQGGSPLGYGNKGWINTAFYPDGSLRPDYCARLERILNRADELGMVVILGLFYFGQSHTLQDDAAVFAATENTLAWLTARAYRHVIIEACNEIEANGYKHAPLLPAGMPDLLRRIRAPRPDGYRFLAGVSLLGARVPTPEIVAASDLVLIHGNNSKGVPTDPARIRAMITATRALPGFRPMPVVINEDDHYDFDQPDNNFLAATGEHVSWGFFDFRRAGDPFDAGFQSVPVDWSIDSPRKMAFFTLLREITGED